MQPRKPLLQPSNISATRALVLYPDIANGQATRRNAQAKLEEAISLAGAIALDIVDTHIITIKSPRPATLFGSGKVEEIGAFIHAHEIAITIVDCSLNPIQQRNLERAWKCKVIDRTALILEIFGERAQTNEGKLQVELAALNYQRSRLVRSWTHLERQRGGVGFMGGPGESQIETDRRLIAERITKLKKQLQKVVRTRELHRKTRRDVPYPMIALVGYTNAGKSTLFNLLTEANVMAEDKLFATLDPTIRLLKLPSGMQVLLSDTVGFVSDLPTDLVAAFRATLEEVLEADIILHICDIAHEDSTAQKADVEQVLNQLYANETMPPLFEVHNKIDLLDDYTLDPDSQAHAVSAVTGHGTEALLSYIDKHIQDSAHIELTYAIPNSNGKALAWLHAHGHVTNMKTTEKTTEVNVYLSPAHRAKFEGLLDTA